MDKRQSQKVSVQEFMISNKTKANIALQASLSITESQSGIMLSWPDTLLVGTWILLVDESYDEHCFSFNHCILGGRVGTQKGAVHWFFVNWIICYGTLVEKGREKRMEGTSNKSG